MTTSSQDEAFFRVSSIDAPDEVKSICFSPDGTLLAVAAGDKVHLYSVPEKFRHITAFKERDSSR